MSANQTATSMVRADTLALIDKANDIVRNCSGVNCNLSRTTRASIMQELSKLAQRQSNLALVSLSILPSSILGRNIYDAYLRLGFAVSSTYNYKCKDDVTTGQKCVTSSPYVREVQSDLEDLLRWPIADRTDRAIVLSILLSVGMLALLLFLAFFIIGLSRDEVKNIPKIYPDPINPSYEIAIPISPFEGS